MHKQTSAKAPKINTIICALETTNEAVPLLRYTADLAKEFNARVCLVNSVPSSESRPLRYMEFDLHKYLVESVRSEIAELQKEAHTDFPVYISSEPISHAITHVAKQQDADLIVIGRGKAQDTFGVLRTHAYQIIRDSPCPVLSYSMDQQGRTSSSYSAEHLAQSEADAQLPTGSRLP